MFIDYVLILGRHASSTEKADQAKSGGQASEPYFYSCWRQLRGFCLGWVRVNRTGTNKVAVSTSNLGEVQINPTNTIKNLKNLRKNKKIA